MREIKFRAWDGKRMTTSGIMFNNSTSYLDVPQGSQMKLMQFTEVKDVDNVEVYEDDIIQYSNGVKCVVKWEQDECFGRLYDGYNFRSDEHTFKVIGNIYENKELLNEQENAFSCE